MKLLIERMLCKTTTNWLKTKKLGDFGTNSYNFSSIPVNHPNMTPLQNGYFNDKSSSWFNTSSQNSYNDSISNMMSTDASIPQNKSNKTIGEQITWVLVST